MERRKFQERRHGAGSANALPLFVFPFRHFSQPRSKHEERVSFCGRERCGSDTERRMARSTGREKDWGLRKSNEKSMDYFMCKCVVYK